MLSIFGLCLYYLLEHKEQLSEVNTIVAYPLQKIISKVLLEYYNTAVRHKDYTSNVNFVWSLILYL